MRARRSSFRALTALAALAFAPKCALCLLAYLGVGAAALGRVEICSAPDESILHATIPWLGLIAGGLLLLVLGIVAAKERILRSRHPARGRSSGVRLS